MIFFLRFDNLRYGLSTRSASKLLLLNLNILCGKYHGTMNVEERVKFMNIFSLVMKRTIIHLYLNKTNNIVLHTYLIASFCDEPCGFAMYCI